MNAPGPHGAARPAGGGSILARRKERTRRELAEAATRLFLERGYEGTTVEEKPAQIRAFERLLAENLGLRGRLAPGLPP